MEKEEQEYLDKIEGLEMGYKEVKYNNNIFII